METGILLIAAVDSGIGVVAGPLLRNGIDGRIHISGQRNRLFKVIAVAGQILLPDQDRVIGCCIGRPLGIDRRSIVDRTAERKLVAVGAVLVSVPSAEGIAVADHVKQTFVACILTLLDETWGVIGRALAVFIKD